MRPGLLLQSSPLSARPGRSLPSIFSLSLPLLGLLFLGCNPPLEPSLTRRPPPPELPHPNLPLPLPTPRPGHSTEPIPLPTLEPESPTPAASDTPELETAGDPTPDDALPGEDTPTTAPLETESTGAPTGSSPSADTPPPPCPEDLDDATPVSGDDTPTPAPVDPAAEPNLETEPQATTQPGGLDGDGDGFDWSEDCDDADAAIHPSAPERCNGEVDSCDGRVDEGLPHRFFPDVDGDGFGDGSRGHCQARPGDLSVQGDCDDTDPLRHAGAQELAGDGIDGDCGGSDGYDVHVGLSADSQGTLADAIAQADDGAIIWVGPGTYYEAGLSFHGRALQLISTHGAELTRIDGQNRNRLFTLSEGEGCSTLISGFTLQNGAAPGDDQDPTPDHGGLLSLQSACLTLSESLLEQGLAARGGAISVKEGELHLEHVQLQGNRADFGGGVYARSSDLALNACSFSGNEVRSEGGGLFVYKGSLSLTHSSFDANAVVPDETEVYARGAGAYLSYVALETLSHTTFTNNHIDLSSAPSDAVARGAGLDLTWHSGIARYCLIANNRIEGLSEGTEQLAVGAGLYLQHFSAPGGFEHTVVTGNAVWNTRGTLAAFENGSAGVFQSGGETSFFGSILAYNLPGNYYLDGGSAAFESSVLYAAPDSANTNLESLPEGASELEPGFLQTEASGLPVDWHLQEDSVLIDSIFSDDCDPDGSPADIGMYGGSAADDWDRDGDSWKDYFWPGTLDAGPVGAEVGVYDCIDTDPSRHTCA